MLVHRMVLSAAPGLAAFNKAMVLGQMQRLQEARDLFAEVVKIYNKQMGAESTQAVAAKKYLDMCDEELLRQERQKEAPANEPAAPAPAPKKKKESCVVM